MKSRHSAKSTMSLFMFSLFVILFSSLGYLLIQMYKEQQEGFTDNLGYPCQINGYSQKLNPNTQENCKKFGGNWKN